MQTDASGDVQIDGNHESRRVGRVEVGERGSEVWQSNRIWRRLSPYHGYGSGREGDFFL